MPAVWEKKREYLAHTMWYIITQNVSTILIHIDITLIQSDKKVIHNVKKHIGDIRKFLKDHVTMKT